jgi:predicted Rossmann fold nucleotide-binding protein DprA/Smf involved in DNA uptake
MSKFDITEVISGAASGVDGLGERWAKENGVPVSQYRADWKKYSRRAGPIRNQRMATVADALVAVWDGQSRGTANMIAIALRRGLKVYVVKYDVKKEQWVGKHENNVGGG